MSAHLTHAVLHHHEAALVTIETFTLETAGRVDAGAVTAQVGRDGALVDICKNDTSGVSSICALI